MSQGFPPTTPAPTPKRGKKIWIILGVLFGLMILICGGCLAVGGLWANEVDKALKEEEANDTPTEVAEGRAFEHDDYAAGAGWKIKTDVLGSFTITGLKVVNGADEPRSPFLTVRVYDGSEVLGSIDCSADELQPGDSKVLSCVSTDPFVAGYKVVKVSDAF